MPSRLILGAAAAAAALALATGAAAPAAGPDYRPVLLVTPPIGDGGYAISTQLKTSTTTETGRLALYAPRLFKTTFPTAASGQAGTASARVQLADQNNTYVDLKGTAVVASGQKLDCVQTTTTPAATFLLTLSGSGLTLSIPMGVYQITGDGAQYSSYVLVECLPPPGVPKGTAGRAPEGARLVGETLTLLGLTGPRNVTSYWTAGWTPFKSGTATLDDSGSVAAQAVTGAPSFVLSAKKTVRSSKTYATLSGRVTRGKLGAVRASVNVYYGTSPARLVSTRWQTTDGSGHFSYETQVSPPYRFFKAVARMPGRTYPSGLCQPSIVPYPCAGISTTRELVASNVVRVSASS
jgi:hypothetical protein